MSSPFGEAARRVEETPDLCSWLCAKESWCTFNAGTPTHSDLHCHENGHPLAADCSGCTCGCTVEDPLSLYESGETCLLNKVEARRVTVRS